MRGRAGGVMTEVTKVQFPKPSDKQASRFDTIVFSKDDERALKFVQSPGAALVPAPLSPMPT